MKKNLAPALGLALLLLPAAARAADPVVSNLTFAQRPGTKLVEITYDVIADTPTVEVWLEISSDGGTTFSVPATTVGGAIGAGVAIGTGKTVTWDAGADWSGKYSAQMRFKVTASDRSPPPPTEFTLIPAGAFQMGDQSNPLVGGNSELPVHTVQVSAFYMGKYEVTKELWGAVRSWGLSNGYADLPAGGGKAANHPVHSITLYDMVKWCNARSEKDGLRPCYTVSGSIYKTGSNGAVECAWNVSGYRLPSEAEWEKAARGGLTEKKFPWGDTISHSQANYYSSALTAYDVSPTRNHHPTYAVSAKPYSSPVGSFAPNGYGLYDMAGNMWEWCWDWFGAYASGTQTDPRGTPSDLGRVRRGGSWENGSGDARCSSRIGTNPASSNPSGSVGFRPARSLVP